jgi:hypothetical protein
MAECVIRTDSTADGGALRGPVGYLAAHPLVRLTCAAAAFTTSLYATTRSMRPSTERRRAAWVALAAITAGEGVGLVAVLPSLKSSPVTEGSVTA